MDNLTFVKKIISDLWSVPEHRYRNDYEQGYADALSAVETEAEDIENNYAWHNIVNNPTDLPEFYNTVDIRTSDGGFYYAELLDPDYHRGHKSWLTDDGCYTNDVVAWRYVEPFAEVL